MLCKSYVTLLSCLLCSLFLFHSSAYALQQADFSWLPNQETNLVGYKIYYSTVSSQYNQTIDVGNPGIINDVVQTTVSGLEDGTTYYFAATAYDTDGFESDYSQEVVWTSPSPPVAHDVVFSAFEDSIAKDQLDGQSPDGLPLTYQIVVNGSKGTASITDSTLGTFIYTPNTNINGIDTFTYKVSDGSGESLVATVTVTINSVNDQPEAAVASFTTIEDTSVNGTLFASDIDNDQLTYSVVSNSSHGAVVLTNPASGAFTYTPDADASGSDTFTYVAHDGHVNSNEATVTIVIDPVNDAPVAFGGSLDLNEDEISSGILQGSDIDSDQLIYSIVSNGYLGTATIIDSVTGTYTYTPNEGAYGEDTFQFVVSDGSTDSNQATVAVTIQKVEPTFAMEIGEVTIDGTWAYVAFTEKFMDPVVVAKPASNNDPSPCVVRIRNLTSTGFEIRLQQFDYLAEEHGLESVSFIVMERGSFTLDDGTLFEAGRFATDKTSSYENVNFSQSFNTIPVVSASVVSTNGSDAVVGRISGINETGFGYKLSEQEINALAHVFETITYIAWEPSVGMIGDLAYEVGSTGDVVTHLWHTINFSGGYQDAPVFISDMQTTDGGDTANMRHENITASTVKIKVAEETSRDSEVSHTTENVGFMAFSVIDMTGDADNDDLINLLDFDSDGDGYSDGVEVVFGFDPADGNSYPDVPTIAAGVVTITSDWQKVLFTKQFINPVVVAKIVSKNESDSCVVRLDNITATGFSIRLQEWGYLDDIHGAEQVSYIVIESGSYTLDDGTKIEAGSFSSNEMVTNDRLTFNQSFNVTPVVAASVASINGTDAVTNRISAINTAGFDFRLQEQEVNEKYHVFETISYIAWEPSVGTIADVAYEVDKTADTVTHSAVGIDFTGTYVERPIFVSDMQTADGSDTSVVRCINVGIDGTEVLIEEEQSRDSEVYHITEVVGYMMLAIE